MPLAIKNENLQLYWDWYPYNEYEELLEAGQIPMDNSEEEEDDENLWEF